MKQIVSSLVIAFSMYSKIPMPKVEWSKENMKYVMCFFPLVGVVLGGVVYLWSSFFSALAMSRIFYTVIVILIPLLLTGGIHMDGFMDTTDALSSYQPREKKLEILKDPNTGAFAVIACVSYFLLTFGFWYELSNEAIPIVAIGFVISRAFSGLAVVSFPMAKNSGLAATFSSEAHKQRTRVVMIMFILAAACSMLFINWRLAVICLLGVLLLFAYYYRMSVKEFGGITGDLAGYFLQLCELMIVIGAVVGGKLCG